MLRYPGAMSSPEITPLRMIRSGKASTKSSRTLSWTKRMARDFSTPTKRYWHLNHKGGRSVPTFGKAAASGLKFPRVLAVALAPRNTRSFRQTHFEFTRTSVILVPTASRLARSAKFGNTCFCCMSSGFSRRNNYWPDGQNGVCHGWPFGCLRAPGWLSAAIGRELKRLNASSEAAIEPRSINLGGRKDRYVRHAL